MDRPYFNQVLCLQAELAVQRGATAVIFDVTDNPKARKEVSIFSHCLTIACNLEIALLKNKKAEYRNRNNLKQ